MWHEQNQHSTWVVALSVSVVAFGGVWADDSGVKRLAVSKERAAGPDNSRLAESSPPERDQQRLAEAKQLVRLAEESIDGRDSRRAASPTISKRPLRRARKLRRRLASLARFESRSLSRSATPDQADDLSFAINHGGEDWNGQSLPLIRF